MIAVLYSNAGYTYANYTLSIRRPKNRKLVDRKSFTVKLMQKRLISREPHVLGQL